MQMPRLLALAAALWLPPLSGGQASEGSGAKPSVISTSLCADQFALALLDPEQILSLSRQADDPELSIYWQTARGFPKNNGSAEEIVLSGADIVISNAWGVSKTRDFLEAQGVQVVALPLLEDLDEIVAMTVDVARQLGVEERGKKLVADFKRRMAAVHAGWLPEKPRGIYLSPGGTTGGAGSFGDRVVTEGGIRNIAAEELGKTGWASVGLEEVILADPDLLVLSFFREQSWSMTQRMRFHSAFTALAERTPHVTVPGESWICSAWFLINAVEAVAGGISRHASEGNLK